MDFLYPPANGIYRNPKGDLDIYLIVTADFEGKPLTFIRPKNLLVNAMEDPKKIDEELNRELTDMQWLAQHLSIIFSAAKELRIVNDFLGGQITVSVSAITPYQISWRCQVEI